jgi:hypothetical protein
MHCASNVATPAYYRNAAANNHLPLLVDELELGKDCLVRVSGSAKYSLATPMNALLWKCLVHFEKVHWLIRHEFEGGRVLATETNQDVGKGNSADCFSTGRCFAHAALVFAGRFDSASGNLHLQEKLSTASTDGG